MRPGFSFGILLVLGLVSCAKTSEYPPVYPIKGSVLYEGRPAVGAVIILHSMNEAAKGPRPRARTEEGGGFALTTYQTGDGAPAGTYVVTVEWKRGDDHPEQGADLLPSFYGDPKTSRLRATVTSGTNEPLIFRLKARP